MIDLVLNLAPAMYWKDYLTQGILPKHFFFMYKIKIIRICNWQHYMSMK